MNGQEVVRHVVLDGARVECCLCRETYPLPPVGMAQRVEMVDVIMSFMRERHALCTRAIGKTSHRCRCSVVLGWIMDKDYAVTCRKCAGRLAIDAAGIVGREIEVRA